MTVTIPTGDLVGLLGDVIPFAAKKEDNLLCCIRLEWDGKLLHAMATDRFHIGWASWHPDDEHDLPREDSLFDKFGGDSEPWQALISRADALHVKKTFKLGRKQWATALTIDRTEEGAVEVARSAETGYSALTATLHGLTRDWPEIREILAGADVAKHTSGLSFTAKYLADFATVRPRGPLHMAFTKTFAHITIGERFVGAIMPLHDEDKT